MKQQENKSFVRSNNTSLRRRKGGRNNKICHTCGNVQTPMPRDKWSETNQWKITTQSRKKWEHFIGNRVRYGKRSGRHEGSDWGPRWEGERAAAMRDDQSQAILIMGGKYRQDGSKGVFIMKIEEELQLCDLHLEVTGENGLSSCEEVSTINLTHKGPNKVSYLS